MTSKTTTTTANKNEYNYRFNVISNRFKTLQKEYPEIKDWKLSIDYRGKTYLGICRYRNKLIQITHNYLSKKDVSITSYLDTINHEVAHSLTKGHNHDKVWKEKCISLGGNGNTCGSISLREEFYKYKYGCNKGCSYLRYTKNNIFEKELRSCIKHNESIKLLEERVSKKKNIKETPYKYELICDRPECDYKYKKYKRKNKKILKKCCPRCNTETLRFNKL